MHPVDAFDVFLDLTDTVLIVEGLQSYLDQLDNEAGLLRPERRLFLACQNGCATADRPNVQFLSDDSGAALRLALTAAAAAGRALVVMCGKWLPGNEAVAELLSLAAIDPLIGSLQPRFLAPKLDRVLALPQDAGPSPWLPREALSLLRETVLTPELLAPLLVLPPAAVRAAGPVAGESWPHALLALLAGLRRKGFRNLICNRVAVACPLPLHAIYPVLELPSSGPAAAWRADIQRARNWLTGLPESRLEALLANAFSPTDQPRILLDARGLAAIHNGTSRAVLGLLGGFAQLSSGFEIHAIVKRDAAAFHEIEEHFPNIHVHYDHCDEGYVAAILLNQPWNMRQIQELHNSAFLIGFCIFDSIAWDVIYAASDNLDHDWRVMAELSDMLFFISSFSRDRFCFRFPVASDMPLVVTHLSLAAHEINAGPPGPAPSNLPYLLVFGNDYDHKDTNSTVGSLADAFPFMHIVAIGKASGSNARVRVISSGRIDAGEISALEAHAAVVVFPSYYEGFGLPVVQALAHGRTVIVRRSPLWEEIAGLVDLPGRLVPYDDEVSLIEAVGLTLNGLTPEALPGRPADAPPPPDWAECANRVLRQVKRSLLPDARQAWYKRDLLLTRLAS